MSALIGKRNIAVTAELVRALGANNAIVLQQVWWWSTESRKANDDDTLTMTLNDLSKITGLSRQAVHRSLSWLRDEGYIEAEGDQKLTYWVTDKHLEIETAPVPKSKRFHSESETVTVSKSKRSANRTTSKGEEPLESGETRPAPAGAVDPDPVGRDGETPSARSVERAEPDRAREIVDFAWAKRTEAGKAKPTVRGKGSAYMAVVDRARQLLDAGHDPELIALTIFDHEAAWTNDSLLVTLSKVKAGKSTDPRLAKAMSDQRTSREVNDILNKLEADIYGE